MNILYIGKFANFFSTENYVSHALGELGHRIVKLPYRDLKTLEQAVGIIRAHKIDMVLFSKPSNPIFKDLCKYCKRTKVTTVTWLWDLFFGFPGGRVFPKQARYSDYVFSTDGGHDIDWVNMGINHQVLRQGIHHPDAFMHPPKYKYDIVFIGNTYRIAAYSERLSILGSLRKRYGRRFRIECNIRGADLNKFLSQSRIVVGHSIDSPHYWSNRIYEVLGRGGFLLHPHTEGLEEEFKEGVHYVGYDRDNPNDLFAKIDHYLKATDEQEAIRERGHALVKEFYTYETRCRELIEKINMN